jgi:hypothetical protein
MRESVRPSEGKGACEGGGVSAGETAWRAVLTDVRPGPCPCIVSPRTGNNMTCFNSLFGYVAQVLRPHGLAVSMSMDNSNHQGPMDLNSTRPWSAEWDWRGAISWGRTLVDMGTYPGGWSKGLSYPAADYLHSFPCPQYPQKTCGVEGQVLDMLKHGVSAGSGQLSPGLAPNPCSADGRNTSNGWTQPALAQFLQVSDDLLMF